MSSSEFAFLGGGSGGRGRAGEWREHRQRLIERGEILLRQFLQSGKGAGGERLRTEHAARGFAHRLLLAGKAVDREFQIARQHRLHAVAIEADQLAQERRRQQRLALNSLLLEDDLGEDRAGDVFIGLGVVDDEIFARLHHFRQIGQGHIGARRGIIQAAIGVFLDRSRSGIGHAVAGPRVTPTGSTQDRRFLLRARKPFFAPQRTQSRELRLHGPRAGL